MQAINGLGRLTMSASGALDNSEIASFIEPSVPCPAPITQNTKSSSLDAALFGCILLVVAVWVWLMWDMHQQTQRSAEHAARSLVGVVAGDLQHNVESLALSVARSAKVAALPSIWDVPVPVRNAALFDASLEVRRLSSIVVTNRDGDLRAASGNEIPPAANFRDRDYFAYHAGHVGAGPLVTGPTRGRIHDVPLLIISERINDANGRFAGVAAGGFLLSYFDELLREFHLDDQDAASLIHTDGRIISRVPADPRAAGTNPALSEHLGQADSGAYIEISPVDGQRRLVAYQKIPGLPLAVSYARATTSVFAEWVRLSLYAGLLLLVLQTIKILLLLRLRRERLRRAEAEQQAQLSACELATVNDQLESRICQEIQSRQDAMLQLAKSQRLEAVGQLAGGIAHDINNVLQTIAGACSLIQKRSQANPDVDRLAKVALAAADRGSAVTRRLLVFARRAVIKADDIDIASVLRDLQELLNHTLCSNVSVALDLQDNLPLLHADQMQLETVIINLATNARDAMPLGGTITIAVRAETVAGGTPGLRPGRYIRLSVIDCGTGMNEETLARSTEPFFSTKTADQGTGLGLPMAKGFAEQSHGKFEIASRLGAGTTVTLWFPARERTRPARRRPQVRSQPPVPSREATVDGARLLVVDDNDTTRELVVETLSGAGFKVFQAASGAEALVAIQGGLQVDLLVTDLSMPQMDGVQLIRAVRSVVPGLPTILLTESTGPVAGLAFEEVVGGRCLVLNRPIQVKELPHCIEVALHSGAAAAETPFVSLGSVLVTE